ncbi:MAG: hypothetical protein WCG75_07600 [Armatimonadota bacterium]
MVNKKFVAWTFIVALMVGTFLSLLLFANPKFDWPARFGLIFVAGLSGVPFFWASRSQIVFLQLLLTWVGRFVIWFTVGYLLYGHWRLAESLILPTLLLPLDWWKLYHVKEKRLEELAAQNLPPMNFNLK